DRGDLPDIYVVIPNWGKSEAIDLNRESWVKQWRRRDGFRKIIDLGDVPVPKVPKLVNDSQPLERCNSPSLCAWQLYSSLHQEVRLPRRQRIWWYVSKQKVMRRSPLALPRSPRGNTRPLIWPSPTSFGATHISTRAITTPRRKITTRRSDSIQRMPLHSTTGETFFSAWADTMRRSRTTLKPSS